MRKSVHLTGHSHV